MCISHLDTLYWYIYCYCVVYWYVSCIATVAMMCCTCIVLYIDTLVLRLLLWCGVHALCCILILLYCDCCYDVLYMHCVVYWYVSCIATVPMMWCTCIVLYIDTLVLRLFLWCVVHAWCCILILLYCDCSYDVVYMHCVVYWYSCIATVPMMCCTCIVLYIDTLVLRLFLWCGVHALVPLWCLVSIVCCFNVGSKLKRATLYVFLCIYIETFTSIINDTFVLYLALCFCVVSGPM